RVGGEQEAGRRVPHLQVENRPAGDRRRERQRAGGAAVLERGHRQVRAPALEGDQEGRVGDVEVVVLDLEPVGGEGRGGVEGRGADGRLPAVERGVHHVQPAARVQHEGLEAASGDGGGREGQRRPGERVARRAPAVRLHVRGAGAAIRVEAVQRVLQPDG